MQKRFGDGVKKGQPGFRGLPSYLKAKLYLFQLKTRSLYIAAVGSNHYMELAGFVYIPVSYTHLTLPTNSRV